MPLMRIHLHFRTSLATNILEKIFWEKTFFVCIKNSFIKNVQKKKKISSINTYKLRGKTRKIRQNFLFSKLFLSSKCRNAWNIFPFPLILWIFYFAWRGMELRKMLAHFVCMPINSYMTWCIFVIKAKKT